MGASSFTLQTVNVTALRGHFQGLLASVVGDQDPIDLVVIQEHSLPRTAIPGMRGLASRQGAKFIAGPTDPAASKPAGGVACLAKAGTHVAPVVPLTKAFASYQAEGRTMAFIADFMVGFPIMVICVYAWPNATKDHEAFVATQSLFRSIFSELDAQPPLPAIIAGDFNIEAGKIHTVREKIQAGQYFDVGAIP
eukprot:8998722-Alexandrium_andersonii.AAC.1